MSLQPDERRERRVELFATILLAFAAVGTAWSTYQSTQWRGQQAVSTSKGTAARIESSEAATRAGQLTQIDIATFVQWTDAHLAGNRELAEFYRRRFRPEFKPAFAAWIATAPFTNPDAPLSPFAMPEYRLAASTEADRLEAAAAHDSNTAKDANERANGYMLGVVLFASALFFAGLSTKLESPGARKGVLALGCVLFVASFVYLATLPVQLTS